ncbi:MAG: aminotransferase class III-fold pyridoxal phosphate-dependent enzyme [Eudoraea sp.]|nr:aminotransferase class III-fold pyridoxal phosphate-dependent enzyme [Eudoraea sp.]
MDIPALLKAHFKLEIQEVVPLEGYGSSNYRVDTGNGQFVLKRYRDDDDRRRLLETESKVLKELSGLKYDFPDEVDTIFLPNKNADNEVLRLHRYLQGEFLAQVSHTTALLHSFGRFLGQMDRKMAKVDAHKIGAREISWDLRYFLRNQELQSCIPAPEDRRIVDYFFLQYEEHISPIRHKLRKSLIHNDANDWNVLTRDGKVSGIIDFGDMCYSWLINELGVAVTYVMMGKEEPLEAAMALIQGYHGVHPLEEQELDLLYYLVGARLCTSVCNSAYSKLQIPDSSYITISEKPAWSLLRKWLSINPIKATNKFREAAGFKPIKYPEARKQKKRRNEVLSKSLSLSYTDPIQMYRSAFQYMYDTEGNTYLDAYNNIMIVGHCHPSVVRAGQRTMARLNTNTRYLYEEILSYSERLLETFPRELNKVFLVNSGSAASDLALRLAKCHAAKEKIAVLEHGYHGNTQTGIRVSHYKYAADGGGGKDPNVIQLPLPQVYGSNLTDDGTAGTYFANEALRLLVPEEHKVAAFIAEPIVGCGGQVPLPKGYLRTIYREIRKQGGVCISDETQVGFGRLGEHFWGFEAYGVVPDLVVLGKPMGNGHPIGAVVTTEAIARSFESGPEFFSSFGGNPVSCAIAEAVLEVIQHEGLQEHARMVGDYLKNRLLALQKEFPVIADVRGSGLFLGVEIRTADGSPGTEIAKEIKNQLRHMHILVSTDGPYDQVLKIKPPLTFANRDADQLCRAIKVILEQDNYDLAKKK